MTYFNEELLTKIQSKELHHDMETMFLYLKEMHITGEMLQADPALFHHFSENVIYPYICKAVLSCRNRNLLRGVIQMDPEEATNTIFIIFCRRLDSLMHSIEKRPDISIHQILNHAINNMVIDLARKKSRHRDELQNDLFWERDAGYLMKYDLPLPDKKCNDILLSVADLKKQHLLAFLGITVAGFTPEMLQDALNRKGNAVVLQALIRFTSNSFHIHQQMFCKKYSTEDSFENRRFTAKELSDLNTYAKKAIRNRLTKAPAKQK